MAGSRSPARETLAQQLSWYEREARRHNYAWRATKLVTALSAATASGTILLTDLPDVIPAGLAALVVILEVVDHTSQPQQTWIRSRAAAEALRNEETLFDSKAGAYAMAGNPDALLAERLVAIREAEGSDWRKIFGS